MNEYQQDILEIAKAFMRDSPGTTPQKALRHAKDIYRNRGKYKITSEEKQISNIKTPWNELPEHVKANIKKRKMAETERKKRGMVLPAIHFVSGGKVSPK